MRFLLACLLAAATATHAQTDVLPAVKTDLKRDKGVLPYAQINSLLTKFKQHGEGLFRMDFKVQADKTTVPLADLRMVVRSDEADHPILIDGEGRFELPLLAEAEAKTADLASNKGEAKVAISGTIELTVPPEQLSLGKVRQVMRVARTLRGNCCPGICAGCSRASRPCASAAPRPTGSCSGRRTASCSACHCPSPPTSATPKPARAQRIAPAPC
jgi:hypothetical protein